MFLEGLNGKLEASQFTFQELTLWDTATPSKPACQLQLIQVDPSGMQSESLTTAIQTAQSTPILPLPPADTAAPSGDIAAVINLQFTGAMT